jgi:hypothetical protein
MKDKIILIILCLFFGGSLMACNEKETEVLKQPEIK